MGPDEQSRIAAAVGFSAGELALNRDGRLSERQRAGLQRSRRGGRIGLVVMSVLTVAFAVAIAVVLVPKISKQDGNSQVPIVPIVVGVLGLLVLIMLSSVLRTRRRLDRLASGKVHQATGPSRTRAHVLPGNITDGGAGPDYGGGVRYELTVGSTTFYVAGQRVLDAFPADGVYRAYFATGGGHSVMNRLLSAERVG